jgi:HlyD family secretion protein
MCAVRTKWKILITIAVILIAAAGVYASVFYSQRGVITVQTGRASRQNLTSIVTASGEIKPKLYTNIGANVMGQITQLLVKEGDTVRKGQLLAKIEDVQQAADVAGQRAALASAEADVTAAQSSLRAAQENIRTMQAQIDRNNSDLERMKSDADRAESLYQDRLLAKQDYELKKASYTAQLASVREYRARLVQAEAQRDQAAAQLAGSEKRVAQSRATLQRVANVLDKASSVTPIAGVVTNLPVRVGEVVVPGIQNSSASLIMTIADMSLITAEVKVDETDIVNVKLDQAAEVSIDAMPNRVFHGHVTEIGNTAILRSTGQAASQSAVSSQEAKDFKVVVVVDDPPGDIRPGLSCTAKITTATRSNVVTIPIQALTVRQKSELDSKTGGSGTVAASTGAASEKASNEELQGVFVISGGKAAFRKVETGITGSTDIEVLSGLQDGDLIITGTYQVIRTIANGAAVKVDNKETKKT